MPVFLQSLLLVQIGFGMLSGAESWPKTCPTGYAQHLATIDDHCEIHYCVRTHVFDRPPPLVLKRPPYGASPPKMSNHSVLTDVIISPSGQAWKRNSTTAQWAPVEYLFSNAPPVINDTGVSPPSAGSLDNSTVNDGVRDDGHHGFTTGQVVGVAVGCVVGTILVIAVVMSMRNRRKRSNSPLAEPLASSGYNSLPSSTQQQDTA